MDFTNSSSGYRVLSDATALTPETLHSLSTREDPLGHLSIYLTADPAQRGGTTPAWSLGIRNRLRELRDNLERAGDRERTSALAAALDEHSSLIDRLLGTHASGIGRMLYLPLSGGDPTELALNLPLGERVVLEPNPFIRPLLGAMERGRPAGIVLVSKERVLLREWRMGTLAEIGDYSFEADTADWREGAGYATAQPGRAQRSASHLERFRRRVDEHRGRFLDAAAADIGDEGRHRDWTRTLIYGDPRLTAEMASVIHGDGGPVHQHDRLLERTPAAELQQIVADRLAEVQTADQRALCALVRERVGAGGAAVMGLGSTLAMLAEGRVAHLLIDGERRWTGALAPDGRMFPEGVTPAGVPADDLRSDTRMGERMIEAALGQGAHVSVLERAAAELGDDDGVGALTRW